MSSSQQKRTRDQRNEGTRVMANGESPKRKRKRRSRFADAPVAQKRQTGSTVFDAGAVVRQQIASATNMRATAMGSIHRLHNIGRDSGAISSLMRGGGGKAAFMPAPLLLDEQGREIDAQGRLVKHTGMRRSRMTAKANQRKEREKSNPYLQHLRKGSSKPRKDAAREAEGAPDAEDNRMIYDPRIRVKNKRRRQKKALKFVEQGKYVKQGELFRTNLAKRAILRAAEAKSQASSAANKRSVSGSRLSFAKMGSRTTFADKFIPRNVSKKLEESDTSVNQMPLGIRSDPAAAENGDIVTLPKRPQDDEDVPVMEWWDVPFLPKEKRTDATQHRWEDVNLSNSRTHGLVEHPVKVDPLIPESKPEALPLMLTKKERKRKRRKERMAKEKEKREKIRLGLIDAPAPKLKMSNLMRVLGDDAVANPSLAEKFVRRQVGDRKRVSDMMNLARKLTPEERRQKHVEKLKKDEARGLYVCIFRAESLADRHKRYKIDVNAQHLRLTGRAMQVTSGGCSIVIVEGGAKALRRYKTLMTRRIIWEKLSPSLENDKDANNEDPMKNGAIDTARAPENLDDVVNGRPNSCALVWEGQVATRMFKEFRFEEFSGSKDARSFLSSMGLVHYFDMAQQHAPR